MQRLETLGPASVRTESASEQGADEYSATDLVTATSAFALDLYATLQQGTDGNLLISPYSIYQILAMALAGARGETAAQIASVLRLREPRPSSSVHQALATLTGELLARCNIDANHYFGFDAQHLRIVNGIWGQQGYPFNPVYLAVLGQHYGSGLQGADFAGAPEAAAQRMNTWVAGQTEGHIRDLLPPDAITPITQLVLANAVWFTGAWQYPFEARSTHDDDFTLIDGTRTTVRFMNRKGTLRYASGDGFQAIEFPYQRRALALTVVLPDEGHFTAFEAKLDLSRLNKALSGLTEQLVKVYLPRFELRFNTSLLRALRGMGIMDAFDRGRADFTGIASDPAPYPLSIDEALHSTFIRVDERGTEAAAALAFGFTVLGMNHEMPEPIVVCIDRPFLYAIRDTTTGTVLFLGRVLNPNA